MKITRPTEEYLATFSDSPVELLPFDPAVAANSAAYMAEINTKIQPIGAKAEEHGSLALGLAGKHEWEYAIFATQEQYVAWRQLLINTFGEPRFEDDEMLMFIWKLEDGQKVELMMMQGDCALRNQAIMQYWRDNEAARKEYEAEKYRHTSSKREYYRWKANYIADILEGL